MSESSEKPKTPVVDPTEPKPPDPTEPSLTPENGEEVVFLDKDLKNPYLPNDKSQDGEAD